MAFNDVPIACKCAEQEGRLRLEKSMRTRFYVAMVLTIGCLASLLGVAYANPHLLISVPRWGWLVGVVVVLGIGAWLRTCVFKIPPDEPYDDW
jgi:hypothetical protein